MDPSSHGHTNGSAASLQQQQEITLKYPNLCGNGSSLAVEVDEPEGGHSALGDAFREIVFGSVAGMVSEVFEYPFDLAKVRLQAQVLAPSNSGMTHFKGPVDCLTQTWKQEGVQGMYRGVSAPLAGSMAVTAALFVSYTSFQNLFKSLSSTPYRSNDTLPLAQLGLAGAAAGGVASFVLTPIELVKCKMQVQMLSFPLTKAAKTPPVPGRIPHRLSPIASIPTSPSRPPHAKFVHNAACAVKTIPAGPPGSLALVRSIIEENGVRGLWLGHTGTMFREVGGCAAWFIVKEYVANALMERRTSSIKGGPTKKDLQPLAWESALSGAMAGAAGALVLYPADTVKSAIQTADEMAMLGRQGVAAKAAARLGAEGFWSTFLKMYRVHGVKGLYAGCGMTVARAIPSSGIIFVVYDGLNNYFA